MNKAQQLFEGIIQNNRDGESLRYMFEIGCNFRTLCGVTEIARGKSKKTGKKLSK